MNNEFGELSTREQQMIREHRAKEAKEARLNELRLKVLRYAADYEQWLQDNGRGDSYSTFVNEFGCTDPERQYIYECLVSVRKAAIVN